MEKKEKTIYEKLLAVQNELKAPKDKRNNFGGYNYRSCECILEAVKPLLQAQGLMLTIKDEVVNESIEMKPSLVTMIVFQYNRGKKLKSKKMLLEELSEAKTEKRVNRILELIALLDNK